MVKHNKLSLNVKKTKFMIFPYRQRKKDNLIPNLKINAEPIDWVTEFNFLGLTIDEQLSWSPHIQKISNKISRTLGIMNRLKRFMPENLLRLIYNSLILPYFQYSLLTWGLKSVDWRNSPKELFALLPIALIMPTQILYLKSLVVSK